MIYQSCKGEVPVTVRGACCPGVSQLSRKYQWMYQGEIALVITFEEYKAFAIVFHALIII